MCFAPLTWSAQEDLVREHKGTEQGEALRVYYNRSVQQRKQRGNKTKLSFQDINNRIKRAKRLWFPQESRYYEGHRDRYWNDKVYQAQCDDQVIGPEVFYTEVGQDGVTNYIAAEPYQMD